MKINEVQLKNFRPYYGADHQIDLSEAEGNGLIVIHGENGRGKTALFHALNWCLFGHAIDRVGVKIPVAPSGVDAGMNFLFNSKALEEGEKEMEVGLKFDHEGEKWELTRRAEVTDEDSDLPEWKESLYLKIQDEPIQAGIAQSRINEVIHTDAAHFYFVDGELLVQYEQWLTDASGKYQEKIKDAIERTVGIRAFRSGRDFLEEVLKGYKKEKTKLSNKEKKNQELIGSLTIQNGLLGQLKEELSKSQKEVSDNEKEMAGIAEKYGKLSDWEAAQAQIGQLETDIDEEQDKLEGIRGKIRTLIRESYWFPVEKKAEQVVQEGLEMIEKSLHSSAHLLGVSLKSAECVLCGQELDDSAKNHIESQQSTAPFESVDELEEQVRRMRMARRYQQGSMSTLEAHEGARLNALVEIKNKNEDLLKLRRKHTVRGNAGGYMKKLANLQEWNGKLKENIKRSTVDQDQVQGKIKDLEKKLLITTTNPVLDRCHAAAHLASSAFEDALGSFSEKARKKVEAAGSDVFRELVQEPGLEGLKIDPTYVVHAVNDAGDHKPTSAAQQLLLTLGLVSGLNAAAVHNAPMVIDTPFGKVDRDHRERMLHWIQELVKKKHQQVILMVHSGEVKPEDLNEWQIFAGRSYRIHTEGMNQSRVLPMDG
jgi:DNA sulfur modification protein DndD